jgi:hypothetical protein
MLLENGSITSEISLLQLIVTRSPSEEARSRSGAFIHLICWVALT